MRKLQTQGVHHITLVGADRQTSIDFWEGVLGMPFVFEQPNLDRASESHLYFDPGDGRLITIFTDESRKPEPTRTPTDIGCVHHLALAVSAATFRQALAQARGRGELPPGADVDALARFLTAGFQGLRLIGKVNPDRAALEGIAATMLQCLDR